MQDIVRQIRRRFIKWTERKLRLPGGISMPTERIGSPYGGWIIPSGKIDSHAVCYLVGAGEDVSFDLGLAAKYSCTVHIFDPTPRAIAHVNQLKKNLESGAVTSCTTYPTGFYPTYPPSLAGQLIMHPVGIWNEDTVLRFFAPQNEAYVSHSIVNLQKTEHAIEVPVRRLSGIMNELGHAKIDLLKIDIEGAEYQVLESIIRDNIPVDIICVEYDESAGNHFDKNYMDRIENSLLGLIQSGFHVIAKEPDNYNFTLIHDRRL
jgi:hypothetical protein